MAWRCQASSWLKPSAPAANSSTAAMRRHESLKGRETM
ncbi:Uncharacterised protein [Bordetella pertussis]|nr:Uncharacterised protein [Bordetella pertussis]CFW41223.1 Uncharacterised protein [Bordetella pertussis]